MKYFLAQIIKAHRLRPFFISCSFIFGLLLFGFSLHAQANPTEQRFGSWNNVTLIGKIGKHNKFRYLLHQDLRFASINGVFEQSITGGAVGYKISNKVSAWAGYFVFFYYSARLKRLFTEHRVWEQILWKVYTSKKVKFISRSILEQRFLVQSPETGWRFRQQFLILLPNVLGRVGFVAFEEPFLPINHPRWVSDSFITQNRLLLGLNIKMSKSINIIAGYLNQTLFINKRNQMNHILFLSIIINLAHSSVPAGVADSLAEID